SMRSSGTGSACAAGTARPARHSRAMATVSIQGLLPFVISGDVVGQLCADALADGAQPLEFHFEYNAFLGFQVADARATGERPAASQACPPAAALVLDAAQRFQRPGRIKVEHPAPDQAPVRTQRQDAGQVRLVDIGRVVTVAEVQRAEGRVLEEKAET